MVVEAMRAVRAVLPEIGGEDGVGGEDGYFPPGESLLHEVQRERAVGLLWGQRALLIGALDPRNFFGTALKSRHRDEPFKRLAVTGRMFESVFFGSRVEADRVLAAVHRMHEGVHGDLPEPVGPFPAGTHYSAFDPELMLWTIAVSADSAVTFYELLVRRLSADERDRLWADWVRFGELFGMPREVAPEGWRAFRDWYERRLAGEEMHLNAESRLVGHGVAFRIPVPRVQAPAMEVHNLIMLGSLPARVRELYGLGWSSAREAAFRTAVRAVRASRPLAPAALKRGRNTQSFELVARTEARRIAAGSPPIDLDSRLTAARKQQLGLAA